MLFQEYVHGGTGTTTISGMVNGTNTHFTAPVSPLELQVYLNGVLQLDGALGLTPYDFTWTSGALGTTTSTITFQSTSAPQPADTLSVWAWTIVP